MSEVMDPEVLSPTEDSPQELDIMAEGKVVAIGEAENTGRVKVELTHLTKGLEVDALPWYRVAVPAYLGGSQYTSHVAIPQMNTSVTVFFPDRKNIYSGIVLFAILDEVSFPEDKLELSKEYRFPQSSHHHFTTDWLPVDGTEQKQISPDFKEDYPFSWGWVDSALNWFKINLMKRSVEFIANNFLKFKSFYNGDTILHIPGNLKIVIEKDLYVEVRGNKDEIIYNHSYEQVIGNKLTETEGDESRNARGKISDNASSIHHN